MTKSQPFQDPHFRTNMSLFTAEQHFAAVAASLANSHPGVGQDAAGSLLPHIDVDGFSRDRTRADPDAAVARPTAQLPTVTIPGAPADASPEWRGRLALQMLMGGSIVEYSEVARVQWLLGPMEVLFPGVVAPAFARVYNIVVEEITEDGAHAGRLAYWQTPGVVPRANVPAEMQLGNYPRMARLDLMVEANELDAAAALGMLAYTVVKTPNGQNDIGFTERRPRAAAAAIGRPITEAAIPTVARYLHAGSVMTLGSGFRAAFASLLVSWVLSPHITMVQGAVIANIRLWRGHGLGGLQKVEDLLLNWGALISQIPAFRSQIVRHAEHHRAVAARDADPRVQYLNAIYGPLSPTHARGDYSDLVMLAAEFERIGRPSMQHFGRRIGREFVASITRLATQAGYTIPVGFGAGIP